MDDLKNFPLAHLAIAVPALSQVEAVYRALGFALHEPEVIAPQKVRAQVASQGELRIELLEPCPAGEGPIAKFLDRRGAGLHHVALRVADLDAALRSLAAAGVQALAGYPSPGMGGTRVAFLDPKTTGQVLYELVEGDPAE